MAQPSTKALTEQEKHAIGDVKGAFKRAPTAFHDVVTAGDGGKYPAEKGRYHLYQSAACPWCHRVTAVLALKGLGPDIISVSNVDPILTGFGGTPQLGQKIKEIDGVQPKDEWIGWRFNEQYPDHLHPESKSIWDIYRIHDADYPKQKLTVPVLFDKKTQKIVSNESSEIIAFLNEAFNAFVPDGVPDLNPPELQSLMTEWNDIVYPGINDGVYRCGFARSQEAYDAAVPAVFACLDKMEAHLSKSRFLCGDTLTLSDVRAWVTLVRFDAVYVTHFKCNLRMIQHSYPNLQGYAREIYQIGNVKDTVDIAYTKRHYYGSHPMCNPRGIVPVGPDIDFAAPHGRDHIKAAKRILMVCTNTASFVKKDEEKTDVKTGFYIPEIAHPWAIFKAAGYEMTYVSPLGGDSPCDPSSIEGFKDDAECKKFQAEVMNGKDTLATVKIEEVKDAAKFDMLFYVGGVGAAWDFPDAKVAASTAAAIYEAGGSVAGVCHGSAGLINIVLSNGKALVEGKTVTGFTNEEEEASGITETVPCLLETELKKKGAKFASVQNWANNVEVSERVFTGQNPASATDLAKKIVEALN